MNKSQKILKQKINSGQFHPNEGVGCKSGVKLLTPEEVLKYKRKLKEKGHDTCKR